jgi:hypothetical protein
MAAAEPLQDVKEASVEELYYRKGDIDFCFLLNRRHHNLRVFDYRVGNYQQKRDFFDRIARTEGLRKVFTVVEKQDSKSWRSVGFSREGAIPGYFRTADAYVMSRVYTEDGDPIQGGAPKLSAPSSSSKVKDAAGQKPRGLNVELVKDPRRLESVTAQLAEREIWLGAETDSSFGHAKVDLLTPPTEKDPDPSILRFCMATLLDELIKVETASVFSLVAVDEEQSNQLYADLGFKVTARLTDHVIRDVDFVGTQLWHRRLANTSAPRLPSFI